MNYEQKLKSPKWQKKRLEILNRDQFTCQYCGDTETTLQVHHKKYTKEPWDAPNDDLITTCEHCHAFIESNKNLIEFTKLSKFINSTNNIFFLGVGIDKSGVQKIPCISAKVFNGNDVFMDINFGSQSTEFMVKFFREIDNNYKF